ncbi:tripartite tricarboxylate transporter substrate binding protein [Roseomonas stagni]|uniref:Tripartite tricarboxylate transporter substrate binding protein n=1 Tax=Falsiroseomonas algicola TaxID=2716930 RepID=A0A6M1LGV3_9PROT|nr:tripartite tricarboxylate transporter substrate-binding protein [Falsiroseomonas algicola]NGM19451.1 tripartite tricarboxylate transporter substrate binding protein [Falsiroseomonas algicola]
MALSRRHLLAAGTGLAMPALAQPAWPRGPIRLVAPYAPGGTVDAVCRLVQPGLQADLGVPVVVENRPGAGGTMGTAAVARSAPDGQTFVLVFDSHVTNPALMPNRGFDSARDLAPITLIGTTPMLVVTPAPRRWRSLEEVFDAARRSEPEAISCASNGNGTLTHLVLAQMQKALGLTFLHVPYNGGGPLATAAAANQTDLALGAAALSGHVASGLVRALAQTGAERSGKYPDLVTLAECGVPGINAVSFTGVLAPIATPEPILRQFRDALIKVVEQPTIGQRLREGLGFDLLMSEPAAFGQFIEAQTATWERVVRETRVRID